MGILPRILSLSPFPASPNGTDLSLYLVAVSRLRENSPKETQPEERSPEELRSSRNTNLMGWKLQTDTAEPQIKSFYINKGSATRAPNPTQRGLEKMMIFFFLILFLLSLTPPQHFGSGDMETSKCFISWKPLTSSLTSLLCPHSSSPITQTIYVCASASDFGRVICP